jgi:hypothetical protein
MAGRQTVRRSRSLRRFGSLRGPPINLIGSRDDHISETARRSAGQADTYIRRTALFVVDGFHGDGWSHEHGVCPAVVYAAVIVLNGVRVDGNRVRAEPRASDNLTDLALEVPIEAAPVVQQLWCVYGARPASVTNYSH